MAEFLEFIAELVLDIFGELIDSRKVHPAIRILLLSVVALSLLALFAIIGIDAFSSPEKNVLGCAILAIISLATIIAYVFLVVRILKK